MAVEVYFNILDMAAVEPLKAIGTSNRTYSDMTTDVLYEAAEGTVHLSPLCTVGECYSELLWANTALHPIQYSLEADANFRASSTFTEYGYALGHNIQTAIKVGEYAFDNDEDGFPENHDILEVSNSFEFNFWGGDPVQFGFEMATSDDAAGFLVQIFGGKGELIDTMEIFMPGHAYSFIGFSSKTPMDRIVFTDLAGYTPTNTMEMLSQSVWVDYNMNSPLPTPLPSGVALMTSAVIALAVVSRRRRS